VQCFQLFNKKELKFFENVPKRKIEGEKKRVQDCKHRRPGMIALGKPRNAASEGARHKGVKQC